MNVLIVVDMQNDFVTDGGTLYIDGAEKLVPKINELMNCGAYDKVILTQDWHPEDHWSFKSWPKHCVAGEWGAELHEDLDQRNTDFIIRKARDKKTDSYSAFMDANDIPSGLYGLLGELQRLHSGTLYINIVGVATDYCVKHTAIDCAKMFDTTVLLQGCKAVNLNPTDEESAINEMLDAGVSIVKGL